MMRRLVCLFAGCLAAIQVAGANPRQGFLKREYLDAIPVTAQDEMGAWLMRLADRYRVEGAGTFIAVEPFDVKGSADCAPVGAGPGIQCIFNIHWRDQFEINLLPPTGDEENDPRNEHWYQGIFNIPGGVSYLNPSMMLIGTEPHQQGLRFLLVDRKGLPEGGTGTIAGNRATLRAPCVNAPVLFLALNPTRPFDDREPASCERITRIDARPGSSVVHMAIDIEINGEVATQFQLTLRRQNKAEER